MYVVFGVISRDRSDGGGGGTAGGAGAEEGG